MCLMRYLNTKDWLLVVDDVENFRSLLICKRNSHECEFATCVFKSINWDIQQGSVVKRMLRMLAEIRGIRQKDLLKFYGD